MNPRIIVLLLGIVAQVIVTGGLVRRAETTLEGTAYRFQTSPVDPVDYFRGRYVRLWFQPSRIPTDEAAGFQPGKPAWSTIEVGEDGLARLASVHHDRPTDRDSIEVKVSGVEKHAVLVVLPFDRFYANERRAPRLEATALRGTRRLVAVVRVKGAHALVADVEVPEHERESERPLVERLEHPVGEALPDALITAIERSSAAAARRCGRDARCLAFPVELDGAPGREWVLAGTTPALIYFGPEPQREPIRGPGLAYRSRLVPKAGDPRLTVDEIGELLATRGGVSAEAPEILDLLIGPTRYRPVD